MEQSFVLFSKGKKIRTQNFLKKDINKFISIVLASVTAYFCLKNDDLFGLFIRVLSFKSNR